MCGASGGVYALIGAHLAAVIMARLFIFLFFIYYHITKQRAVSVHLATVVWGFFATVMRSYINPPVLGLDWHLTTL